ncbi:MAG: AF1514 family protein [Archaeoglobus sp.]|nr:AF1514 family protein [Archaeoglobus sp.]
MDCKLSASEVKDDIEKIKIKLEGIEIDFELAEEISKLIAERKGLGMIVAWYDPKRNVHFPNVECCGEDEPSWYIYGKSRGGKLLIDVGGFEFLFL